MSDDDDDYEYESDPDVMRSVMHSGIASPAPALGRASAPPPSAARVPDVAALLQLLTPSAGSSVRAPLPPPPPRMSLGGGSGGGSSSSSSSSASAHGGGSGGGTVVARLTSCSLDYEAVAAQLVSSVVRLQSLFGVASAECALLLLAAAHWDVERLGDAWVSEETARRDAGVSLPGAGVPGGGAGGVPPRELYVYGAADRVECPVLLAEVPLAEMWAPPCGHWASQSAWREYILALLEDPAKAALATCMQTGCPELLRPSTFAHFLADAPGKLDRYREFFLRSYIAGSRSVALCPATILSVAAAEPLAAAAAAGAGAVDGGSGGSMRTSSVTIKSNGFRSSKDS